MLYKSRRVSAPWNFPLFLFLFWVHKRYMLEQLAHCFLSWRHEQTEYLHAIFTSTVETDVEACSQSLALLKLAFSFQIFLYNFLAIRSVHSCTFISQTPLCNHILVFFPPSHFFFFFLPLRLSSWVENKWLFNFRQFFSRSISKGDCLSRLISVELIIVSNIV